jgi:hypothetical protein
MDYKEAIHQLFISFKKVCDSVRRDFLYNLTEYGIPMKLLRVIEMCLNDRIRKHLFDIVLTLVPCIFYYFVQ